VEQYTKELPSEFKWPCIYTTCNCGLKNRVVYIVLDPIACMSCKESIHCSAPKVFLIKDTFKKQKKRARNSDG
jgi:hypothetical protein